jgi:hypothetical protein
MESIAIIGPMTRRPALARQPDTTPAELAPRARRPVQPGSPADGAGHPSRPRPYAATAVPLTSGRRAPSPAGPGHAMTSRVCPLALLLLDVLEVGELIDAGEQPVEFLLDLAGASFDVSDPRELIGFEELGTPRWCAGDEPFEPARHQCTITSALSRRPSRKGRSQDMTWSGSTSHGPRRCMRPSARHRREPASNPIAKLLRPHPRLPQNGLHADILSNVYEGRGVGRLRFPVRGRRPPSCTDSSPCQALVFTDCAPDLHR